MQVKIRNERALAILESAAILTLLSFLIAALWSSVAFIRTSYFINNLVFSSLNDLEISQINTDKRRAFLVKSTDQMNDQLRHHLSALKLESAPYYIEANYADLGFDTQSGKLVSLGYDPQSNLRSIGNQSLLRNLSKDENFLSKMQGILANGSTPSALAFPSGVFGISSQRYRQSNVILGVRCVISLEYTFAGGIYKTLGGVPILTATNIALPRKF